MYLLYAVSILFVILAVNFYENKYILSGCIIISILTGLYGIILSKRKKKYTKDAIRQIFSLSNNKVTDT